MLKLYSGDRKTIMQQLEKLSKEKDLPLRYTQNIFSELEKQYGFFFSPSILYFIYDNKDFDKDNIKKFDALASKNNVICIIETELDKRGVFYKKYGNMIEYMGETKQQIKQNIRDIPQNEIISFLYKMFYNNKYKSIAGECINLVLAGKIKTENILQIFLLRGLDKKLF